MKNKVGEKKWSKYLNPVRDAPKSRSLHCNLCRALKSEAEIAAGETERAKLILFVLAEHEKACHGSN